LSLHHLIQVPWHTSPNDAKEDIPVGEGSVIVASVHRLLSGA